MKRYIGLFTRDSEVRAPKYRRVLAELAVDGDDLTNATTITFPEAACDWGTIVAVGCFDENGVCRNSGPTTVAEYISALGRVHLEPGNLRIAGAAVLVDLADWDARFAAAVGRAV